MTVHHQVDPNREATYDITLGVTFHDIPIRSLHALKYNFKPAAIDYSQPGILTSADDGSGDVSLALPSAADGEHHIFKGPMQEAKATEFVLIYDPETNTFTLERLSTMTRLSATRTSRTNPLMGTTPNPSYVVDRTSDPARRPSVSSDDIPSISLDPAPSMDLDADGEDAGDLFGDPSSAPAVATPRLAVSSPHQPTPTQIEAELSDGESEIEIRILPPDNKPVDPDDDVSDEDLDNLANELESSLENHSASSSDPDSDHPHVPRARAPDIRNAPRSGGPISMSRFAGGKQREEEESSSDSDDD